jgi:hypothetical protein
VTSPATGPAGPPPRTSFRVRSCLPQPAGKTTTRVVSGLTPGTRYTFAVTLATAGGIGAPASVTTTTAAG